MRKIKEEKGITLAALTVTIIILLILAGVTISATVKDNGLIPKVQTASKNSSHKNVSDALMTLQVTYTSMSEYMNFLKEKKYINNTNNVNVKRLLEMNKVDYGNGTGKKDVYIIENR